MVCPKKAKVKAMRDLDKMVESTRMKAEEMRASLTDKERVLLDAKGINARKATPDLIRKAEGRALKKLRERAKESKP